MLREMRIFVTERGRREARERRGSGGRKAGASEEGRKGMEGWMGGGRRKRDGGRRGSSTRKGRRTQGRERVGRGDGRGGGWLMLGKAALAVAAPAIELKRTEKKEEI